MYFININIVVAKLLITKDKNIDKKNFPASGKVFRFCRKNGKNFYKLDFFP
jgi:hypothetical protein